MKKQRTKAGKQEMLSEYDFRGGIRGKYAKRFSQGSNVIVLDRDVAEVFTDSESVNQALRALSGIFKQQRRKAS
ncbi:MAG: hypothetical protein HY208_07635 [Nitrospirae bacterium]|nr:hypothetical protein [Nitrospirota bacterium]